MDELTKTRRQHSNGKKQESQGLKRKRSAAKNILGVEVAKLTIIALNYNKDKGNCNNLENESRDNFVLFNENATQQKPVISLHQQ